MYHIILTRIAPLLLVLAASFIFVQCDNRTDNRNSAFEEQRTEMTSNLENLRDDLDNRIDDLESRISDADNDEAERNMEAQRRELRTDRSNLDRAIDNLQNATEDTWQTVRAQSENLHTRISSKLDDWTTGSQNRYDN
ncbi:MAG: hypothetical protein LAT67_14260 [Balneolales bacterium]|nr:hypothetical protein [Balneolales bacterium]